MQFEKRGDLRSEIEDRLEDRLKDRSENRPGDDTNREIISLVANSDELAKELSVNIQKPSSPRNAPRNGEVYTVVPSFVESEFHIRWVIKNDDLDILAALLMAVASPTAVALIAGAAVPPAAIAAAIVGTFLIIRKMKNKGVRLDKFQYDILLGLKQAKQGLSVEEIREWFETRGHKVSVEEIKDGLDQLSAIRQGDGNVVPLVNKDYSGKFSTASV
jgi:hypothetical protein